MSKVDSIWLGSFRESPWLLFLHKLGNAVKWLRPKRAIIFGSAVTNGFDARDFDLLIVSDYFLKILWQERPSLLSLPVGPTYDLRLFASSEFDKIYPRGNFFRESIEQENIDLSEYYE